MSAQLTRRCVLALLAALAAALGAGLLAWGPIGPGARDYPDLRTLAGLSGVDNALASLPLLLAACSGIAALHRSRWPATLQRPWRLCFVAAGAASLLAALFHLLPSYSGYLLAQWLMTSAFTLLLSAFLAERAHPQFGSRSACAIALLLPLLAALWALFAGASIGVTDLRGLLLLQLLPLLLVPAGALALPGRATSGADWLAILALYAIARALDIADAAVHAFTGWASGHSLMHLALAGVALWPAYRLAAGALPRASRGTGASSQRVNSANTSA